MERKLVIKKSGQWRRYSLSVNGIRNGCREAGQRASVASPAVLGPAHVGLGVYPRYKEFLDATIADKALIKE